MNGSIDRRQLLAAGAVAAFGGPASPPVPRHRFDLDVTSFGARGDGQTDDTAAFQAAIEAASREGGGRVYVPTGRYIIGSSIKLESRVQLHGAGSASVLESRIGESGESVLDISDVEHVSVSRLRIDGIASETRGVWIRRASQVDVDCCEIVASGVPGVINLLIHIDLSAASCRVSDNVLVSPHIAILLQEGGGGAITDCIVRGNVITMLDANFEANGTEAIKIDKRCIRTLVDGNLVRGSRLSAITVEEGCIDTVLTSNVMHPAAASGIRIEDGQGAIPVDGIVIADNVVRGGETGIFFGQENSARQVVVHGNKCSEQAGQAMLVWAREAAVHGNACTGEVVVRGERITISGNQISDGSLNTETLRHSQLTSNVIDGGNVVLWRATDLDVVGNVIRPSSDSPRSAIDVGGSNPPSSEIRVTGNVCASRTSAPDVSIGANVRGVTLSSNLSTSGPPETVVHPSAQLVDNRDELATYAVQSPSTQRSFDIERTDEAELARVLGTLISDLQAKGIVG